MSRQIISTPDAPAAIGTYSQAVRVGNTIWVSGQIPLDPATKELVKGDMEAQVRQVFENLKAIVVAAGATFDDVVKGGAGSDDNGLQILEYLAHLRLHVAFDQLLGRGIQRYLT